MRKDLGTKRYVADNEVDKWMVRITTVKVTEEEQLQVRTQGRVVKYHASPSRPHHGVELVGLEASLQERGSEKMRLKRCHRVRSSDSRRGGKLSRPVMARVSKEYQ